MLQAKQATIQTAVKNTSRRTGKQKPGKIQQTTDFTKFRLGKFNRDVETKTRHFKNLVQSMQDYGWIDAYPMHVVENGNRFEIVDGHHRFEAAKKLSIPAKYVVCPDVVTIPELQGGVGAWKTKHYVQSYARMGNQHYASLDRMHKNTGIGYGLLAGLLTGWAGAMSGGAAERFRHGGFEIKETEFAYTVVSIIEKLQSMKIPFATHKSMVLAAAKIVSASCEDDRISIPHLRVNLGKNKSLIEKQPNTEAYLDMFEQIYNRRVRGRKINLSWIAKEEAKKRQAVVRKS